MTDEQADQLVDRLNDADKGLWPGKFNEAELEQWVTALRRYRWDRVEQELFAAYRGDGNHRAGYKPSLGAVVAVVRDAVDESADDSREHEQAADFPELLRRRHPNLRGKSNVEVVMIYHAAQVRSVVWPIRKQASQRGPDRDRARQDHAIAEEKLTALVRSCQRDLRAYAGMSDEQALNAAAWIDANDSDFEDALRDLRNADVFDAAAA
ncbi:MAG: hypothetical protein AAGD32_05230 [Planctomycetota bacterium]